MHDKVLFHNRIQTFLLTAIVVILILSFFCLGVLAFKLLGTLDSISEVVNAIDVNKLSSTVDNSSKITEGISSLFDLFN